MSEPVAAPGEGATFLPIRPRPEAHAAPDAITEPTAEAVATAEAVMAVIGPALGEWQAAQAVVRLPRQVYARETRCLTIVSRFDGREHYLSAHVGWGALPGGSLLAAAAATADEDWSGRSRTLLVMVNAVAMAGWPGRRAQEYLREIAEHIGWAFFPPGDEEGDR